MSNHAGKRWYWLFLIPFVATLWPPFYASYRPTVAGFPFMYWYLILWIFLVALISGIVYWIDLHN
ncbi:MAG: hypothetical protein C7B46_08910 [Sulfobacillus benefaciens]|uniref:DUF3311 domain-containing protein n=1 Tax=Sulfobacillus benefaciens TaxID=453960 RepID=A0A2T2XGT3_9FIRM|nr:MAG: hypothetical protein C7B46_08910 [Sulfobacillus benefaciens]